MEHSEKLEDFNKYIYIHRKYKNNKTEVKDIAEIKVILQGISNRVSNIRRVYH